MTTYHTARETDGVPAPSEFDTVRSTPLFHEFVIWMRLWLPSRKTDYALFWSEFNKWGRDALLQAKAAADERETQLAACDRWTDGEGIRHDPHFDACY